MCQCVDIKLCVCVYLAITCVIFVFFLIYVLVFTSDSEPSHANRCQSVFITLSLALYLGVNTHFSSIKCIFDFYDVARRLFSVVKVNTNLCYMQLA